MTFTPDHSYRAALFVGALFLLLLFVLALARNDSSPLGPAPPRRKLRGWWLLLGAAIVGVSVGGWLAILLVPLCLIARRWGSTAVAIIAGLSFASAGILVAVDPNTVPSIHAGAFGAPAQFASVLALCAVLSAVVVGERREARTTTTVPR